MTHHFQCKIRDVTGGRSMESSADYWRKQCDNYIFGFLARTEHISYEYIQYRRLVAGLVLQERLTMAWKTFERLSLIQ